MQANSTDQPLHYLKHAAVITFWWETVVIHPADTHDNTTLSTTQRTTVNKLMIKEQKTLTLCSAKIVGPRVVGPRSKLMATKDLNMHPQHQASQMIVMHNPRKLETHWQQHSIKVQLFSFKQHKTSDLPNKSQYDTKTNLSPQPHHPVTSSKQPNNSHH